MNICFLICTFPYQSRNIWIYGKYTFVPKILIQPVKSEFPIRKLMLSLFSDNINTLSQLLFSKPHWVSLQRTKSDKGCNCHQDVRNPEVKFATFSIALTFLYDTRQIKLLETPEWNFLYTSKINNASSFGVPFHCI